MRSITDFQIRTSYGKILSGSADELHILSRFIDEEGVHEIAKVSFYYEDEENVGTFHNLILRNEGELEPLWNPEFSTSLIEEQKLDLALAIQLLKTQDIGNIFQDKLIRYIRCSQHHKISEEG